MAINKISLRLVVFLSLYLAASFLIVALEPTPALVDHRMGMIPLSNFEGYRPFQYRVLMPLLIRGIEAITPAFIKDSITALAAPKIMANMERRDIASNKINIITKYVFRSVLYICLQILMIFFFLIALRLLANALKIFPKHLTDFVPLGIVLVMPVFYDSAVFIFDFPHLAIFTFGLYLLGRERWGWYMIIFALGLLNKETTVFLAIVFALVFLNRLEKGRFWRLLAWQAVIFMVIKLSLYLVFKESPGGTVEWHLPDNIKHLATLSNYFRFSPIGRGMLLPFYINIPVPHGLNLPMFAVIIASVCYGWAGKPMFLKRALGYLVVVIPIALAMALAWELRSYNDLLPTIYLLGTAGIYKFVIRIKGNKPGTEYGSENIQF